MNRARFLLTLMIPILLIGAQATPTQAAVNLSPTDDGFVSTKAGQRDTNFDAHQDQLLVTAEGFPVVRAEGGDYIVTERFEWNRT